MIYIDKTDKKPLYEQIYAHYVKDILSGRLEAGKRLPATRELARTLSVSRNTIDKAYQQLAAEGYVQSRSGSGFYVNIIPLELNVAALPEEDLSDGHGTASMAAPRYDFAYGPMDNSVFPYDQWRRSISNALAKCEAERDIPYPNRPGEPELQRALCRYLYRSRGVVCRPEQIIITCGQQHAMEIIANTFGSRVKRFAMEEPGYDGIRAVFRNHGHVIQPVPVEEDGVSLDALRQISTDLLYLTPAHQFPTGAVLSVAKRRGIISWARETGAYIIEDDYDSELRYYTNPIPAMQSTDPYDRTIYTGTFSKSFSPSTRLAYIVFPPSLLEGYYGYYYRYNAQVTRWHQLALADFVESGHYERHINRLRTMYRKKQEALISAIREVFGDRIGISGGGAGIHLLLDVKGALSQDQLIARAAAIGIRLHSTKVLYIDEARCPRSQLLLGFPTIPAGDFRAIMKELKIVWEM